jgi:hypothetical protein
MTRAWAAVFAGPLAWFAAHVASWMLVPPAHRPGGRTAMVAIELVALAIAFVAGLSALARLRLLRRVPADDHRVQRKQFIAIAGVALSAITIVLMIGLTLPNLLLTPGAEP